MASRRPGRDRHEHGVEKDLAGQTIGVQGQGQEQKMRISGLFEFSSEGNIGGATLAAFNLPTAQELFKKAGKLDQIRAAAKPGRRRRS